MPRLRKKRKKVDFECRCGKTTRITVIVDGTAKMQCPGCKRKFSVLAAEPDFQIEYDKATFEIVLQIKTKDLPDRIRFI